MTIYVDLLFIINLFMNYMLLTAASVLARGKISQPRLLIGAGIGALYSVFVFFPKMGFLLWTAIRLGVSAVMTAVAIPVKSGRQYFEGLFYFYICLFVFGGGMYIFHNFTSAGAEMMFSNGVYYVDMPLWLLLTLSFAFYGFIRGLTWLQGRKASKNCYEEIEICCLEYYTTITAFLDTGNSLQDPLTLAPVVIVEVTALKCLLPPDLYFAVLKNDVEKLEELSKKYRTLKCRFIPYRGVDSGQQLLFAVRPAWIRKVPAGKPMENVVLGLTRGTLSPDGSYHALLHHLL